MALSTLDGFVREAEEQCKANATVHNLFLYGELPISEFERPFGGIHFDEARMWQAPLRPEELHINHGEYIHAAGDGIAYIIDQLAAKPDGNRALFSLLNMRQIVPSGDRPIPSFLILQFARVGAALYCTAYFRALEVSAFLPVNLTEIALIIREIRSRITELTSVKLCVHSFRAYSRPTFDRLRRAELDQQPLGTIALRVAAKDKDTIRHWLEAKKAESSVMDTHGLDEMYNALNDKIAGAGYDRAFRDAIGKARETLARLGDLRQRSTFGQEVDELSNQFRALIGRALEAL